MGKVDKTFPLVVGIGNLINNTKNPHERKQIYSQFS